MPSNKFYKYMEQYGERNYAPKIGKIEKSDLVKYKNRNGIRKTKEASGGDSPVESGQKSQDVNISCHTEELTYIPFRGQILNDAWVINLTGKPKKPKKKKKANPDIREK